MITLEKIAKQEKEDSFTSGAANGGIFLGTNLIAPTLAATPMLALDANKKDNSRNINKVFDHYTNKYKKTMKDLKENGFVDNNVKSVVHSSAIPKKMELDNIFGYKIHGITYPKHAPEFIVAHELSHYNNFLFNDRHLYNMGKTGPLAASLAAAINTGGSSNKDKDRQKNINTAIGAAGTLATLPMLAEESKANLEAYRTIKHLKGKVRGRNLAALIASQGSYMANSLAPGIATLLANKYIDSKKNKSGS